MSILKTASLVVLSLSLGACATSAVIKNVQDLPAEELKAGESSKPIQFTKVVVKLKRGEHIGAVQAGILCLPNGDLQWKGGRLNLGSDEFTEAFKDELEKLSFKTVGDTNALFEDASTWKSEILVAGMVKELQANICFPAGGFGNWTTAKAEAFLKVDWQIYSKLDRSVVHSVITEGAGKTSQAEVGGGESAVLLAFAQATRNLLADEKFRQIVSHGGETVKATSITTTGSLALVTAASAAIGETPSDWQNSVVTIFAGSGHGSGFVVSDDLILTNQHVVGESANVTVKFGSGMQLIGKVLASNSRRDVAIIKVPASLPKRFRLATALPAVGVEVYAIGTPLDEELAATVSRGIVSAIREQDGQTFIQSDVNVRPGNSGGPLLDRNGTVLGITVSGLQLNGAGQGINFFVPIQEATHVLGVPQ